MADRDSRRDWYHTTSSPILTLSRIQNHRPGPCFFLVRLDPRDTLGLHHRLCRTGVPRALDNFPGSKVPGTQSSLSSFSKTHCEAMCTAPCYVPHAINQAAAQELHKMVASIIPEPLTCLGVVAATTALGAAAGLGHSSHVFRRICSYRRGRRCPIALPCGSDSAELFGARLSGCLGWRKPMASTNVAREGVEIARCSVEDRRNA